MKKIGLFLGAFLVVASCLFGQSQEIRFSISGGPDADKFEIVEGNQLKLKKGVAADYEASDKLEVEVTADNGISKVSKLLSVEVADVSEVVSVKLDNATVKENASGAKVGNLTAVFAKEKRQKTAVDPSKVDQVSFVRHIRPIFQESCVECHGPDKQKGDLRLDGPKTAIGESIIPGKPDKSELYKRITLPPDDIDIMPSEGKPLSQAQTELIRKWIKQGANWPKEEYYDLIGKAFPVNLVEKPVTNEAKIAMAQLKRAGIPVKPVAQDANWMRINFGLVDEKITDTDLKPLAKMPHLTEVDLGETEITDKGLAHLKGLLNLTRLDLNNTALTDKGLAHLSQLQNLTYLNLYGTQVSDAGLKHLTDLKSLRNLYVWQTEVTASGAKMLEGTLPGVTVNRGDDPAQPQKQQTSKGEKAKKGDESSSTPIAQVLLETFSE